MQKIFIVSSHVEVEKNNWSSEIVGAFSQRTDAEALAKALGEQAESNETIELQEVALN